MRELYVKDIEIVRFTLMAVTLTPPSNIHQANLGRPPSGPLLGRGNGINAYIGNQRFRTIVASHKAEFLNSIKMGKAHDTRRVVGIVQSNGGQFLRKNDDSDWDVVDYKKDTKGPVKHFAKD